jgi:hypothetical protein
MNLYRPRVKRILARRPSGGFDPFTALYFKVRNQKSCAMVVNYFF